MGAGRGPHAGCGHDVHVPAHGAPGRPRRGGLAGPGSGVRCVVCDGGAVPPPQGNVPVHKERDYGLGWTASGGVDAQRGIAHWCVLAFARCGRHVGGNRRVRSGSTGHQRKGVVGGRCLQQIARLIADVDGCPSRQPRHLYALTCMPHPFAGQVCRTRGRKWQRDYFTGQLWPRCAAGGGAPACHAFNMTPKPTTAASHQAGHACMLPPIPRCGNSAVLDIQTHLNPAV